MKKKEFKTYDDYDHLDPERDNQLLEAVRAKQDEERAEARTERELNAADKWLNRWEAAVIAFEEGRPRKLIALEKSLGIEWKEKE